ncbi:MAG: hypothetical protein LBN94_01325 [Puniceicoccales bacterium]|jgi:hypothetical protein|nr:hypothetical protein [Puniceicoccales bacterium]
MMGIHNISNLSETQSQIIKRFAQNIEATTQKAIKQCKKSGQNTSLEGTFSVKHRVGDNETLEKKYKISVNVNPSNESLGIQISCEEIDTETKSQTKLESRKAPAYLNKVTFEKSKKKSKKESGVISDPKQEAFKQLVAGFIKEQNAISVNFTLQQKELQQQKELEALLKSAQRETLQSQIPAWENIQKLRTDKYGSIRSLENKSLELANDANKDVKRERIGELKKAIDTIIQNKTNALAEIEQAIQQIEQGQPPLTDQKSGKPFLQDVVKSVLDDMKKNYDFNENNVRVELLRAKNLHELFDKIETPRVSLEELKALHSKHEIEENLVFSSGIQQLKAKEQEKVNEQESDAIKAHDVIKAQIDALKEQLESYGESYEQLEKKVEFIFDQAMEEPRKALPKLPKKEKSPVFLGSPIPLGIPRNNQNNITSQ